MPLRCARPSQAALHSLPSSARRLLVAIILVDAFVDTDALRKVKDLVIIGTLDVDPKIFELDVEPPAGYQPRGDRDSAIPRTLAKLLDDTHKIATTSDDSDRALLALKIHKQALSAAYAHQNMIDSSINVNTRRSTGGRASRCL
uniref:Uncharacterized protein n=1 Tax=Hemiselmis tepida TaxID=464990 RepID=A0A7S0WCG3_9CRYP|mmetsp:Transcript_8616/g.22406  ORF Transcript_8616/g.22406 Transcript_8616/m.22406 type:complete len:144 (+) Transcript_8616:915-1346(+)